MEIIVTIGDRERVLAFTGKVHTVTFAVPVGFAFAVVDHDKGLAVGVMESEGYQIGMLALGAGKIAVSLDGALLDAGIAAMEIPSLL